MNRMELLYRQTGAQGASGISLLLSLFDRLARDLQRGAEAQRAGDIERRCKELNHALALIGFLENWIDETSGPLAQQMAAFYSRLRRRIIVAQAKQSAEMLEEDMAETLRIREIWQRVDTGKQQSAPEILPPQQRPGYPGMPPIEREHSPLSWSA